MLLDLLPHRTGGAAENMAVDFLLLQRYPETASPRARFRHYDWRAPAFTFGYGQKVAYIREQLVNILSSEVERVDPNALSPDLTRRPTGGGLVDHREDWTYALVIPRGHPLYDARATESYRQIHAALAASLRAQHQPAILKETCSPACEPPAPSTQRPATSPQPPAPTICFTRPELHDVLHEITGAKIAGAAQKRTKHGLLFQGSLWKPALAPTVDWDAFAADFTARLARLLEAEPVETPWPDFHEDELSALTDQYSAPEWIEHR